MTCDRSWFLPGSPVSSINKSDLHNTTESLLNVALLYPNQLRCFLILCINQFDCIFINKYEIRSEWKTIVYYHALLGQICLESNVVCIYIIHDLHTNIDNTLDALGVQ